MRIRVGQLWRVPVHHLGGQQVLHRVTGQRSHGWFNVEPLEPVNGYCMMRRERLEDGERVPAEAVKAKAINPDD